VDNGRNVFEMDWLLDLIGEEVRTSGAVASRHSIIVHELKGIAEDKTQSVAYIVLSPTYSARDGLVLSDEAYKKAGCKQNTLFFTPFPQPATQRSLRTANLLLEDEKLHQTEKPLK